MSKRRSYTLTWKLGAKGAGILVVVVSLVLVGSASPGQQQNEPPPSSAAPAPPVEPQESIQRPASSGAVPAPSVRPQVGDTGSGPAGASLAPPSAPPEGIKVHGHWTIEVRDPDGTLVTRREFENVLLGTGAVGLTTLLTRQITMGLWNVRFTGTVPPCSKTTGPCFMIEKIAKTPPANWFATLTVEADALGKLMFKGTADVTDTSSINLVQTGFTSCLPSVPPNSNCEGGTGAAGVAFTQKSISPAVGVTPGQQVLITVVMTFS